MSYQEVMDMPIRAFWFMNAQVERVVAFESITAVPVSQCAMGGEGVKDFMEQLKDQMGKVIDERPIEFVETDEESKAALKRMSGKVK